MNRNKHTTDKNKKYTYVGNCSSFDDNNHESKHRHHHDCKKLQKRLDILSERLKTIEKSLASSGIIKITPLVSLISTDVDCLQKINQSCIKWIEYITKVANDNHINYNIISLFWKLDEYIFDRYFSNLIQTNYFIEFIDYQQIMKLIDNNKETMELNEDIIQMYKQILEEIIAKNRYDNMELIVPPNKEYISFLIKEKHIFIGFFYDEIHEIINTNNVHEKKIHEEEEDDFHFSDRKLHPSLSLENAIIGDVDSNSIPVKTAAAAANNSFEISDLKDKRYNIIYNKRPLYNTTIDAVYINKLNSSLYRFSPVLLNLSLIIFHVMIHIKCNLINREDATIKDHGSVFLKEIIKYLPSVLYGHPVLPNFTLRTPP